jgi:hypothetical protein
MSIGFRRLKALTFALRVVPFFVFLLLISLAGEFAPAQAAGISLVQHTGKDAGTTTTSTLTFPSSNTAGNFIAVAIRGGLSSSQVFTVSDSSGNTYKKASQVGFTASVVTLAIYYAENVKGAANTVTVSMTVSGPLRFAILEYAGVATANSLDASASATNQGTSVNSGSVTTIASGDLLLGMAATADAGAYSAGAGYAIRDFVPAEPNTKLITEDQIQTAAGTVSGTAALGASGNWGAILAAFKPTGGGVAGTPANITAAAGTPQSAIVGTAFATQLQATVKDSFNNPVSGATVTFAAPSSGASGTFAGGVTTATTNASGIATAPVFTANTVAGGPYIVTASVAGVSTPANFSLTNLAGSASSITTASGTPQSAAINTAFAAPLQAIVQDSFNNPVAGATVTFATPGSGASGTFASGVNTATTNSSGVATAGAFTANSTAGGPYIVRASVPGAVAGAANFSLTNLAGPAASIAATAGTPQSATVNTAFATQLQATVKDSANNPVNGITVTFATPASGSSGTFAGGVKTATTNPSGVAIAPVFSANTAAGPYTVTASVSGVATPTNFSLTNLAGAAANITATAGASQSASINTAFATQLQATVKDSLNNPVNGATVTFTVPASGASGTFAGGVNTATTNASGVANAPVFTANGTAGGPYTVTASTPGVAVSASFSLTNLGNPPANIAATAGTPQSAAIKTAFATQLQVTVTDSGSNPVNGVTVTFAAPASGASGTFAGGVNTATTNASGVATSPVFTANSIAGGPYTVTASVSGVSSPASFSLTNLVGSPASIAATAGTPQNATVGTAYTTQFQATVKDSGNNPVSGATVTFAVPASGAGGTFAGGVNTATTNASGIATAAVFTANTVAGAFSVTASVSGVSTPANFSATNLAGAAANIAATTGTPQSATVSTAFAAQLQATVNDSFNNPVSGVTVTFAAPASGASGTFAGGVNTATTNASGVATSPVFTANSIAGGPYTVTASASGVATPASFSLTNVAGVAANIALVQHAGKDAGTTTTSTLAFPSSNTAGNFIAVVIRGGLSSSQVFTVKDSNANTYKQAKQLGFTASVVTMAIYYAENIKGGANTVTVSMSVSGPWRVAILEYSGVATSNSLDVAASATNQGTSANSGNVTTTGRGDLLLGSVATADSATFTAGAGYAIRDFVPAQPNTKLISEDQIQSASGTASASATLSTSGNWGALLAAFKPASGGGGAGTPSSITATAGTPQNATVSTSFGTQLQATVKDSSNNPVTGITVTFVAPSSGPSGTFAGGTNTAITNVQGVATAAVFTANATVGSYTVTASVSGLSATANFSLTNLAAPSASITATAGTPQSATVGTAFTATLQATVKDASNNPVNGATVTFVAPASGASGTFAGGVTTATTNASGIATAALFTANNIAGAYSVTASVSGVSTPATFALTNLAGSAANIASTSGTPQSAVISTAFATRLQATVTDSLNNPVSGVIVTFTPPPTGASGTFANGVSTAATNAQGIAVAPVFTANATVGGPYTVTASASGIATPASFALTNVSASANINLVQHRSIDASTASSNSLAFATSTTAGNWIAVGIRGSASSAQVFTVSDSNGNTYHKAFQLGLSATLETFALYYAENIRGGADTINVAQSVLGTLRFAILEYSGVATSNSLDGTPATSQGNSATLNTGNVTSTANGDLLLSVMITKNSGAFTPGSGYTVEEAVQVSPNTKIIAEDQLQSAAGTVSASASLATADLWGAGLAAFRSASGNTSPISVSVSPTSTSLPAGYGTQTFTATVTNDFLNRGVTWSLSGPGCSGSTCGSLSRVTLTSAAYAAPLNIPSPPTVTLTATSIGDTTKSASAVTTMTTGVLTVVLSPKRAAVTLSSSPVQFTANVYNDPSNSGVTWQVDGNNGGTSASGTISSTGLYTSGAQPGQHTVTAISNANASISGSALMAVTDLPGVYTHHNDNARTGQNLKEYGLTPANVSSTSFGQLFSCPVDGYVYTQPLWVANLNFGGTTRNVVFIATEHNSVYAFDADSPACVQLWQVNFLGNGVTTLTTADVAGNTDIVPEIGITSTPVIDPATNTIYVVPKTRETVGTVSGQACSSGAPCYVHRLHALDLTTGAEKFTGPVVITATNFTPSKHLQRPALLLANNTLYLAFGSHGDQCPYQGWVMGYNPSTLAQIFANSLTDSRPSAGCNQGAIWQSGAGPAADASGNVYVITANGLYDGTLNFGDSVVKLSPTGSILDWFTPFNQSTLAANDVDLGSDGVLILPDSAGSAAHPHLALATGKISIVYLLDQNNMGKFNSLTNNDVQEVIPVPPINTTLDDGGNYGLPAYWNGNIYNTGQNFPLSQFQISNGAIITPQAANSTNTFPPRGGIPAVSANGATTGIVWIVDSTGWQSNSPAILDAYDATNVGTLLFSSPASGPGSSAPAVKWSVPTVANGKVYVGAQFSLTVFGLLPN